MGVLLPGRYVRGADAFVILRLVPVLVRIVRVGERRGEKGVEGS